MKKIAFTTFGCKTNHYDSDLMAQACLRAGLKVVSAKEQADIYVINTCTVTAAADAQARNIVRRFVKQNPQAKIIVCGCSSELWPQEYQNIQGVDQVLGVRSVEELIKLLDSRFRGNDKIGGNPGDSHFRGNDKPRRDDSAVQHRARAFLKIQDGCDNSCAYCIIPQARGKSRSVLSQYLETELQQLLAEGFQEIILTGIHIGRYGQDLQPKVSLPSLINKLLKQQGDFQLRLSSLDPDELNNELIELLKHPRVCRHLHLSLQSGSDEVLRLMNRKTGVAELINKLETIKKEIQGLAIGADIIVGFPRETEELFQETKTLLNRLPLSYLQVFPYSIRPGTLASTMLGQISDKIKKERAKELREISEEKKKKFYQSQVGKKVRAIVISKKPNKDGCWKVISDNYLTLFIKSKELKYKQLIYLEE
ncbi:MAG: tRNA (N(6)-L-threonylcarbamoyladenosine(37)-C(2))-methylthiotransferase MtaB [Pseudomonadota bacterium]